VSLVAKKKEGDSNMKQALEGLIGVMEEEIEFKEADLEETIKLLTAQLETRKKELDQLRQQLYSLEQKWR
jgi:hypothetical protein